MEPNQPYNWRNKIGYARQLAFSKGAFDSLTLFSGSLASSFFSLIAIIFISRQLGPTNFGIFATYTAIVMMALQLTDFGLGTAAVKVIANNLGSNRAKALAAMKVIFKLEMASGLVVGLIGLAFAKLLTSLLGGEHLYLAVRLAFLAGIFSSASAYVTAFLNAHRQFLKNSLYMAGISALRLAGVLALLAWGELSLNNILWLYTALALINFAIGYIVAPKGFLETASKKQQSGAFWEIFHFSKWVLVSFLATTIISKLDIFLLSRFKGSESVGLYAAALQLASVLPLLIGAVSNAVLPRFSALKERNQYYGLIKKLSAGSLLLAIALLPAIIFAGPIIKLVFGSKYDGSLDAFRLIFGGYLIALVANPLGQALYSLNKTKVLAMFNLAQLALVIPLDLWLIPRLGAVGAGMVVVASNLAGGIATVYYLFYFLSRPSNRAA